MNSLRDLRRALTLATLLSSAALAPALADTIVKGRVTDPTNGAGVSGAILELRRGADVVAAGISDLDGYFELAFAMDAVPEQRTLALGVVAGDYLPGGASVVVTGGRPDRDAYAVELMPVELRGCRGARARLVVVGYFGNPATGADAPQLAYTLVTGLQSKLLPELQKHHLPTDFQPVFQACPDARPASPSYLDDYARTLRADAFLSGDVLQTGPSYRVRTYVGDRHGVFDPPRSVVNDDVAVADPAAAELDVATHAYLLVALANGYAEEQRYAECVDVCVAAEQLLGAAVPEIAEQRERCRSNTDNAGLVP